MKYLVFIILFINFAQCISVYERRISASSDLGRDGYPCSREEGQEVSYVRCNHEYLVSRYTARIEYLRNNQQTSEAIPSDYLQSSRDAFDSGKFKKAAGYAVKVLQMDNAGQHHAEAVNLLYQALLRDKKFEEAYAIQKKYMH